MPALSGLFIAYMKRTLLLTLLLLPFSAQAVVVKYTLAENSSDSTVGAVRTTAFPAGNAPIDSPSACSTWTCAQKGDAAGEIEEVSSTSLSFSASGTSDEGNEDYAYQTCADSGDCQVKARIPASWTGHLDAWTGFGVKITEGGDDADYIGQCWIPNGVTRARHKTGAPGSTSEDSSTTLSLPMYVAEVYDQSETSLSCFYSSDDSEWTLVSTEDKTLSCDAGSCRAAVFGTSASTSGTTFATITDAAASSTITVSGDAPDPGDPEESEIWSGKFPGDFRNYHANCCPDDIYFWLTPEYGRPPQYGNQIHTGNGDLLDLVTSPTRGGTHAAKMTIKNSANGSEGGAQNDCDPALDCQTRRTGLQMTKTMLEFYEGIPQGAERWIAMSFFIPNDFELTGQGGTPVIWGSKGSSQGGSGWLGILISNNGWRIDHRFYPTEELLLNQGDNYWRTVAYDGVDRPNESNGFDGLNDFPNEAASRAALANLNKGGWTDIVIHFKTDIGQVFENNDGFIHVYMRAGSGSWIHVLNMQPMEDFAWSSSGSWPQDRLYDRGIGQYGPNGYTWQTELYGPKSQFWDADQNTVIYVDNNKVHDESADCTVMAHDGSDCTQ